MINITHTPTEQIYALEQAIRSAVQERIDTDPDVADCYLRINPDNWLVQVMYLEESNLTAPNRDVALLNLMTDFKGSYGGNEETGEDGRKNIAKLYQLFYNHAAEGATYVMLNMPGGDISEVKYLLPIIDNSIDGYYDIERISFGTRTKLTKDGQYIPNYPTLRIRIGAYHPLDHRCTEGIVPHMANQIWSYAQLRNVMEKFSRYEYIDDDESIVSESEAEYESLGNNEADYIKSI